MKKDFIIGDKVCSFVDESIIECGRGVAEVININESEEIVELRIVDCDEPALIKAKIPEYKKNLRLFDDDVFDVISVPVEKVSEGYVKVRAENYERR